MLTMVMIALLVPEPDSMQWGGNDFVQYYAGAKLMVDGHNPYDRARAGALQMELGRAEPVETFAPPWALLPALALLGLSFQTACIVNIVFGAIVMAGCAMLWWQLLFPVHVKQTWIALVAFPLWLPSLMVIGIGQNTIWPLAGLSLWMWFTVKKQPRIASVCLVLLVIKPHLGLLPGMFILGYWLRQRDWRSLVVFVITLLFVTGLTVILRPTIWWDYLGAMQTGTSVSNFSTATWYCYWQYLGSWVWLAAYSIWVIGLGEATLVGWQSSQAQLIYRLAFTGTISLAVVPYCFSFDLVLMLPLFLAGVGHVILERPKARQVMLGWFLIIAYLVTGKFYGWSESAFWIVSWLGLGLGCLVRIWSTRMIQAK
jgi:hypothetical protein